MPESSMHMSLVNILYSYVKKIVPNNNISLILLDSPSSEQNPISVNDGFRPDLSYQIKDLLILGEAKTDDDVERRHSLKQYYSYLKEVESFDGEGVVVFCVSWKMYATLKNHLRVIKKRNSFNKAQIVVLNNKGDVSRL